MEKIIIFDWGGIVDCHSSDFFSVRKAWYNVIKKLGKNDEHFIDIINSISITCNGKQRKISEISDDRMIDIWIQKCLDVLGSSDTIEDFQRVYAEEFSKVHYYKEVTEYIHSLHGKCKLGVLSNLAKWDRDRIDKQMDLSSFDYIWLSYELNTRKPESEIYEIVENTCHIYPDNILFLDDTSENINIAAARGWNTVLVNEGNLPQIINNVNAFLHS